MRLHEIVDGGVFGLYEPGADGVVQYFSKHRHILFGGSIAVMHEGYDSVEQVTRNIIDEGKIVGGGSKINACSRRLYRECALRLLVLHLIQLFQETVSRRIGLFLRTL
ncbi:MAG: hypothetical protein AB7F40_12190 [Victivallaceae bacterium]